MASTRIVEFERGTYTGRPVHPHNGYYAGDFHTTRQPAAGSAQPHTCPAGQPRRGTRAP